MVVKHIWSFVTSYIKKLKVRNVLLFCSQFYVQIFLGYVYLQLQTVAVIKFAYTKFLILGVVMTTFITYTDL